jgi:hypothetical protein
MKHDDTTVTRLLVMKNMYLAAAWKRWTMRRVW